ncbi:MAG: hypothetical protein AABZ30_03755 [Myxococcota bacterium]
MKTGKQNRWNDDAGVAATEYIIILVLVAVAAIGVWRLFGKEIRDVLENATDSVENLNTPAQTE